MTPNTTILQKGQQSFACRYSICTIVSNWEEYAEMRKTFDAAGFNSDSEYLTVDNSKGNMFDAYEAIASFFLHAKGAFIILVHQDVRLIDDRKKLEECLDKLDHDHSDWAICGNAGAKGYHQHVTYITYTSHEEKHHQLPCKVNSLDENFLVVKRSSGLTISSDLQGFHLYGTDLCVIANIIGRSAYVIPFMVLHLSEGNIKALEEAKGDFILQYGEKLNIGYVQTTCTQFYLSNSRSKNRWMNSKFIFFLVKQTKRYPFLFKKLFSRKSP